jgi:hypothetical protein|tara:strand:- start:4059 stop:4181 length:123 start_codon:yes stop_codon:yes gene_type:complete
MSWSDTTWSNNNWSNTLIAAGTLFILTSLGFSFGYIQQLV